MSPIMPWACEVRPLAEPVKTTASPVLLVASLTGRPVWVALTADPSTQALQIVVVMTAILADLVQGQSVTVIVSPA